MFKSKLLIFVLFNNLLNAFGCPTGFTGVEPNCGSCPDGHYCPTSNQTILCPKGTTNAWIFGDPSARVKCVDCQLGDYNDKAGGIKNETYTDCKVCPLGHYCPSIDQSPKLCPINTVNSPNFAPGDRIKCSECSVGYFNDIEGGIWINSRLTRSNNDCKVCNLG